MVRHNCGACGGCGWIENDALLPFRTKNGVAVGAEPSLTGRHQVLQPEKKFMIEKPTEHDAGNYTCTIKGTKDSATFQVLGE